MHRGRSSSSLRRDEESEIALDVESVSALNPDAHPLAVYAAVERTRNRRKAPKERTQFSARTIEARLSARGFPEDVPSCTEQFAARAAAIRSEERRVGKECRS